MLLALIAMLSLFSLLGCQTEDVVASISIKDYNPDTSIEIKMGDFDYSAYTVVAVYESGRTEELTLTEDMISETDTFKLYQIGDHDITVNYGNVQCTFKLSVKRATFEELTFPENSVFTYNGEAHTVEVDGDIPASAVVSYIGGNSFVNAGTYDVIAVVSCEGYVTEKLYATVKIERASYDMSGVKFESKDVTYDGKVHSIEISGELPEGVSPPTYVLGEKLSSGATDVGVYTVTAKFPGGNPNYEPIPDMQATLTIHPATYEVKDVSIVFRDADGKKIENFSKIYDGKQVVFDISDYDKLSNNVAVSFSVFDKNGTKISNSNKATNIKDAGVYTVRAEFTHANGKNYNPIEPVVCEFEIERAPYPAIENVKFKSALSVYNGREQSIVIDGTLPEGVEVSYVYYFDGNPVLDADGKPRQSVVDAGRYTVEAVFSHDDANLGKIPSLMAAFYVEKVTVDTFLLGFSISPSVIYTGNAYEPGFISWKDANMSEFDVLEYSEAGYYVYDSERGMYVEMDEGEKMIEVGLYRIIITMTVKDRYINNYVFSNGTGSMTYTTNFEICRQSVATPEVEFGGLSESTYSGNPHQIEYTCDADTESVTLTSAYYRKDGTRYVLLGDGALPVDAGIYKFVVTATLKDEDSSVFTSGNMAEEYSFEFEIKKLRIDFESLLVNGTQYQYTGNELRQLPYDSLPWEIRRHLSCSIVRADEYSNGSWTEALFGVQNVGYYGVTYAITVLDFNNVSLIAHGAENRLVYYFHTFYIVN